MLAEDRSVLAFSVTTVDAKFNYSTALHTTGLIDIKLGVSTFADADRSYSRDGETVIIGAHRTDFKQAHYLANPGNYQSVVFINTGTGVEARETNAIHDSRSHSSILPSGETDPSRWPRVGAWVSGIYRTEANERDDGGPSDDHSWLGPFRESWVITGFTITPSQFIE